MSQMCRHGFVGCLTCAYETLEKQEMKTIQKPKYRYKLIQAELWGNAKDGFDSNNWFTLDTKFTTKELSDRFLVKWARDYFTGNYFAWSANSSRPMSRKGIEISAGNSEGMIEVQYRCHYVGEIQRVELCNLCGDDVNSHWNSPCDALKRSGVQSIQVIEEHA